MAGEWQSSELGPRTSKIGSGATPRGGAESYLTESPFALIRSQNVHDLQFSRDGLAYISAEQADALSNVEVQAGDVLINITGDSVARVCMVDPIILPARVNQHVAIIRSDPSEFDQRFLLYSLVERQMKQQLLNLASAGATRKALTKGNLERLKVAQPPITVQRSIADLLGVLDDKIELNRRLVETLEGMARALFKSWFIDFDPVHAKSEGRPTGLSDDLSVLFPDSFAKDGVPEGWTMRSLETVLEINARTSLPTGTVAPYIDMAALPMNGARVRSYIDRLVGSGSRFQNGDTVVARITPCLENGKTAIIDALPPGEAGWGSTEFIVLRPREGVPAPWPYLLARDDSFRAHLIASMTGTSGRQRVPPSAVSRWETALPPKAVLLAFGLVSIPLFDRIRALDLESDTLEDLRDALLPKLISGELRISDTEKRVAVA